MQKLVEKLGLSEGAASATLWVILSAVLLVIIAMLAVWLVRTLRPSLNMSDASRGGRPRRLAITDAFPLDRDGRKLVIVRRDNTEHLLLIGGPNDLLVESNITRHDRALRGVPRQHDGEGEEMPVQMPQHLAPQMPLAPLVPPAPLAPPPAPLAPAALAAATAPTSQAALQTLLASGAAAARMPSAPAQQPVSHPMPTPVQQPAPPPMPATPPMPAPVQQPAPKPVPAPPPPQAREPLAATAAPAAPPTSIMPVLTLEAILTEARNVPGEAKKAEEPPPAPPTRQPAMSEMARRLNEALQKPVSGTLRQPFNRPIRPAPPTAGASAAPGPKAAPPPSEPLSPASAALAALEASLASLEANQPPESPPVTKADIDLLEEEMARLLGRPTHPSKSEAS